MLTVLAEGRVLCEGGNIFEYEPFTGEHCSAGCLREQVSGSHWRWSCRCRWRDVQMIQKITQEDWQKVCSRPVKTCEEANSKVACRHLPGKTQQAEQGNKNAPAFAEDNADVATRDRTMARDNVMDNALGNIVIYTFLKLSYEGARPFYMR